MPPKTRTQLYLDRRQRQVLEEKSAETGKSIGYLIREAIDEYYRLTEPSEKSIPPDDSIWEIVGLGESNDSLGDGSVNHDDYIYGDEHKSWS